MSPIPSRCPLVVRILTVCAIVATTTGTARTSESFDFRQYVQDALRGDVGTYLSMLDGTDGGDARLEQLRARLGAEPTESLPATGSEILDEAIATYRDYWRRALRGEIEPDAWRSAIEMDVTRILDAHDIAHEEGDDVLEVLAGALRDEGFYVQGDRTRPFEDLLVWQEQESQVYDVELHDTHINVSVNFMSDFMSSGWMHYVTLGLAMPGGWAKPDALYCMHDKYDRESEAFLVSYLKHEGRHFADYDVFPELGQIDLEYRAKLTELIYAETGLQHLLEMFLHGAAPDPASPHALANFAVVKDLEDARGEALDSVGWSQDVEATRSSARTLLDAHSGLLHERGAETITGVVEARFAHAIANRSS